jgi:hypothetical protein
MHKDTISVVVFDPEDPGTLESLAEPLKEYQSVLIPCASKETMQATIGRQPVDVVVLNLLPKPFDPDELKYHVVHAAEKHHAVRPRKRPPAESVKELNATSKRKASAAGT